MCQRVIIHVCRGLHIRLSPLQYIVSAIGIFQRDSESLALACHQGDGRLCRCCRCTAIDCFIDKSYGAVAKQVKEVVHQLDVEYVGTVWVQLHIFEIYHLSGHVLLIDGATVEVEVYNAGFCLRREIHLIIAC